MKEPNNIVLDDDLMIVNNQEKNYSPYWLLAIFLSTVGLGIWSASWWSSFNVVGVHWEVIISLVILIGLNIICLVAVSRDKRKHYRLFYSLITLLLWMGYAVGWNMAIQDDFINYIVAEGIVGAIGSILIGMVVFFFQGKRKL